MELVLIHLGKLLDHYTCVKTTTHYSNLKNYLIEMAEQSKNYLGNLTLIKLVNI